MFLLSALTTHCWFATNTDHCCCFPILTGQELPTCQCK